MFKLIKKVVCLYLMNIFFVIFLLSCSKFVNKYTSFFCFLNLKENCKFHEKTKSYKDLIDKKSRIIEWKLIIYPMLENLFKFSNIRMNSTILIDSVENNSSFLFLSNNIIDIIIKKISDFGVFNVIPKIVIEKSKKFLGFAYKDSLVTKSKVIGLARHIKSDYVLYLCISDINVEKEIIIQLIDTNSGEMVWVGKNFFK